MGVCLGEWARHTGWVRVSRGSHSGHVPFEREPRWRAPSPPPSAPRYVPRPARPRLTPQRPGRGGLRERSTTGEGLRLVPLESIDPRDATRHSIRDVLPPWDKDAYRDPEAGHS